VAADQVAAQATERRHPHGPFHSHCENCGTRLEGPWCHRCGQHDFEFHRSFRHVFLEALESFFHFEGKFFRNIITLLFLPGRLTAEFNAGKRAAQMPPFRLYVFVSFLFFFLLFLSSKFDEPAVDVGPNPVEGLTVEGKPQTLEELFAQAEKEAGEDPEAQRVLARLRQMVDQPAAPPAAKSLDAASVPPDGQQFLAASPRAFDQATAWQPTGRIAEQARRALAADNRHRLGEAFLHALPKMLLFCLPFFALYTRVLFRGSGLVYLQHLVLALHFHTFIYLFLLLRDGWGFLAGLAGSGLRGWVILACSLWLFLYPFLMLRRLFANSWPRTLFKTGLLGLAYGSTLLGAFAVTALILLLLL